jgi:predicted aldo/keto reductase-like oxidoreductase
MATAGRTTKLGDDFTVSAMGFGAGALAPVYGDVDDAESLATLNRCLDLGVTFIDTANVYGDGDNERLIAKLLARRRSRWHGCGTAPRPSVWPRYRFPAPGGRHASRRTLARCRSP